MQIKYTHVGRIMHYYETPNKAHVMDSFGASVPLERDQTKASLFDSSSAIPFFPLNTPYLGH